MIYKWRSDELPTVVEFHLPTVVEDERERERQVEPYRFLTSAVGGGYSPSAVGGAS